MPSEHVDQEKQAELRGAPDVGAFYLKDATVLLERSGCIIGKVEFALPPRRAGEAAALEAELGRRVFRVLRSHVYDYDESGNPICCLLLAAAGGAVGKD